MAESDGPSVARLLSSSVERLRRAGIESARRDARVLLCHVAGLDVAAVVGHPERRVCRSAASRLNRLVARRAEGEPLSRVLGRREFWSLPFRLSSDTLDPRPDSETVVEAVLARISDRQQRVRVLDLGTGTGCLLLALLSELPQAFGVGIDLSAGACSAAADNARDLGLEGRAGFVVSDWASSIRGGFDIVVANPPYIGTPELPALSPEVRGFDPRLALWGGEDGLVAYRALAPELGRLLRPHGFAVIEVGSGQAEAVGMLVKEAGLTIRSLHRDLSGIERCLTIDGGNP